MRTFVDVKSLDELSWNQKFDPKGLHEICLATTAYTKGAKASFPIFS